MSKHARLCCAKGVEFDQSITQRPFPSFRREIYNPHVRVRFCRCREECWQKSFDDQKMSQVVNSELNLDVVFAKLGGFCHFCASQVRLGEHRRRREETTITYGSTNNSLMPALHIRMSSLEWVNFFMPSPIDSREVKSHSMKVICTVGVDNCISAMSSCACFAFRPVK